MIHVKQGVTRALFRRERVEHANGHTISSVPAGHEVADIEMEIDLDAIAHQVGVKAMKNKKGRSRAQHGLIKCTVRNRRHVPP